MKKSIKESIVIPCGEVQLQGILSLPMNATGLILFVHGSGSSRLSPRNQFVADKLNQAGFATVLFDLLTEEEAQIDEIDASLRFDIPFLADRLVKCTQFFMKEVRTRALLMGYFGASTGGGAALLAAVKQEAVKAVVSRGGRPDLAGEALKQVKVPTLFIVGEQDEVVIRLNQLALEKMHCVKQLTKVPGATHLFEEAGALEAVAELAKAWFLEYVHSSQRRP